MKKECSNRVVTLSVDLPLCEKQHALHYLFITRSRSIILDLDLVIQALSEPVSNVLIPYSDLRPCVNSYIQKVWQEFWDLTPSNKFFQIQPKLDSPVPRYFGNRKRETIFSRLHIGHSYFSHSFLLRGEDPPYCTACDTPYTVEHVLIFLC